MVEFTSMISQACHILCLLLPIIVAYLVQPGTSSFSWHPFLMTTTYSFINLQAILVFMPERTSAKSAKSLKSNTNTDFRDQIFNFGVFSPRSSSFEFLFALNLGCFTYKSYGDIRRPGLEPRQSTRNNTKLFFYAFR